MDKKTVIVAMAILLAAPLVTANDYIIQDSNGDNLFVVNSTGEVTVENGNLNLGGNSLESATVPWSTLNNYPSGCDPDEAINQVGDTVDCVALDAGGVVNTTGGAQNEISFFLNNDTVTSDSQLYWDSSNNQLGVGIANPSTALDVSGGAEFTGTINLNTNQLTGLEDPDNAQDAATKSFVETYADNNDDTGTDNQTLSTTDDISGTDDSITITNGNTITVDDDYAADDQNLGTSGNQITLDNGGSITVPYANNADTVDGNQPSGLTWSNLGVDQSDISVSDLGSSDANINMNSYKIIGLQDPDNPQDAATKSYVETYADSNDDTGTDDQNLQSTTRTGSTVTIPLENGGTTTFNDQYEPNTDTQDLSVDSSSQDDVISLDNGGSITIDDDTTSNTDEQVAVDGSSSPGYLGSSNDGVLRPNSELSYVDNGNYITLGVQASNINHDSLSNINYNDHHGVGSGIRWDSNNDIALDANDLDNSGNIADFSAGDDLNSSGGVVACDGGSECNVQILNFENKEQPSNSDGRVYFDDNYYGDYSQLSGDGGGIAVRSQDGWGAVYSTANDQHISPTFASNSIGGGEIAWSDANDLNSNGGIKDFSNSDDLDTAGDVSSLSDVNTDDLTEGTSNKYYTTSRARADVRASDVGLGNVENIAQSSLAGDQLSWDSTNNEIDLSGSLYGDEDAQDAVGTIMTGSGPASVNYDDGNNQITISSTNTQLDDEGATSSVNINSQNINNIGGLQNCGSDEFVNGNGNCVQDSDTADDQDLQAVLAQDNSAGSYNIDMNGRNMTSSGGEICAGNEC